MNDFSVGDFAEQIMKEKGGHDKSVPTPNPPPSYGDLYINEKPIDISEVSIPSNFLEAVNEGKELEFVPPPVPVEEDKDRLAESNPLAGEAIDIIIEGLGNMLDSVQQTLNEVKKFVNENSLANEMTVVGGLSVNMAPSQKKRPSKVGVFSDEEKNKPTSQERVKTILSKFKDKKKVKK